jgi:hypothetical protein
MDSEDLLPGKDWELGIRNAIQKSDLILVLFSRNLSDKKSFIYKEIRAAFDVWKEKLDSDIFIIPIRLELCEIPRELEHIQAVDLFKRGGMNQLIKTLHHIFTPTLPPLVLPGSLVQACADGECVLYAGAGLSARSGFPIWKSFVEKLLEWAVNNNLISKKYSESLRLTLKQGDSDLVVDSIVSELNPKNREELLTYLQKIFLDTSNQLSNAHHILKEIGFNAILTTNFDDLLERTFGYSADQIYTPQDTEPLLNRLAKREFFILKLHGTPEKPGTVLLAPSQYEDSIAGNLPFSEFMESLFFSRTLLFLGASLEGIETYLEGINFRGYIPHHHYALAAVSGRAWQAKADMLERRYGIQVLPYALSKDHPEVETFLAKLAEKTRKMREAKTLGAVSKEEERKENRLKRILLENIGPFDKLELNLSANWNILLGDNGVGKSTILRAIAVGICGKDAEDYAHRLIKSGKNEGMIVLETDRNKYVTKLYKRNGGAEIRAVGRILETEGWLTVGFPPLRTVSWERPKGPELVEGKSRPTTDDVLPLVTGEPDPRMNKLKQWIINLDYYRLKDEQEKKGSSRYGKLLDEFFRVVNHLAEGISIRFKGVDMNTRQVTIISDDGEIPIEAVSQGTISLIGWIGILMQRLYEVYGPSATPGEQFALVLIDEIDAHMHPQWQQSLVPNLVELFPGMQFIATSHSPLVVGSRQPNEVFTLRRDHEKSNRVLVERMEEPFLGWRADQILTTPLFGLNSSRDINTQKLLVRYTELAALDKLSANEQQEMEKAARTLKIRMPSTSERKEARKAFEIILQTWQERMRHMSAVDRKKVLNEINMQIQEMITGSEIPR